MPSANLDIVRLVLLQAFEPLETYDLYGPPGPRELATHQETYSFLSACCLVSKDWYDVASPLLYSTIVLPPSSSTNQSVDQNLPSTSKEMSALQITFRHRPSLLQHVQAISGDGLDAYFLLEQPHAYPNLRQLGTLNLEWRNQGSWITKVVSLRRRFPALEALRLIVSEVKNEVTEPETISSYIDLRSSSLQLPESLRKLSLAGPNGFLSLDAFMDNTLPRLAEFEVEVFGAEEENSTFLDDPNTSRFFERFGKNITSFSIAILDLTIDERWFDLSSPLPHFPSCPSSIFSFLPSLRTVALQGIDLQPFLLHGHPKLEALKLGLVGQPSHVAGSDLDLQVRVRLSQLLPQLSNGFRRVKFPLLKAIQIASLDFRLPSDRESALLRVHAPVLLTHGLHLFDARGTEWASKPTSWPAEVLASSPPVNPSPEAAQLHRQRTASESARRIIFGQNEDEEQEDEDEEDDENYEEEEYEDRGEESVLKKDVEPEGRTEGTGEVVAGLSEEFLAGDAWQAVLDALWGVRVGANRSREIMEEHDLSLYADEFVEQEKEKMLKEKEETGERSDPSQIR